MKNDMPMTFKMEIRHSILLNKMVQELTGMITCGYSQRSLMLKL